MKLYARVKTKWYKLPEKRLIGIYTKESIEKIQNNVDGFIRRWNNIHNGSKIKKLMVRV